MESMEKVRLGDVANEVGKKAGDAFKIAKEMGLNVKTASSSITMEEAGWLLEYMTTGVNPIPARQQETNKKPKKGTKTTNTDASRYKNRNKSY